MARLLSLSSFRMPLLVLTMLLAGAGFGRGEPKSPSGPEILARLLPTHPRLLAGSAEFDRLKVQTAAGEGAKWLAEIRGSADKLIDAPASTYEIPDGKRLLAVSRRVLERTLTLGLVFKVTGDARYSHRLWNELDAAVRFKNWNPSHFLDTAEMTAAISIGYDWLHKEWSAEQRGALRRAIVELGLKPSLDTYRKNKGWAARTNNWNQVCNGGMTVGALAVGDEEPKLAGEILAAAVKSLPRAMRNFSPDGAWGEGPGYWDYAVRYNVLMLAALDFALGTDFGLSGVDGFPKTADFPIHVSGPLGRTFNYADASDGLSGGPHIFWLAAKFSRPDYAAWRLEHARSDPAPLDLLWGGFWIAHAPPATDPPLAKYFRGPEVVTMRSAWHDRQATFVGFKGGDNKVSHSHLDLGTFVLDAAGERWAVDPGGDDYNLPGYFGKRRWEYYRLRAEGQNTLVIGPDSNPDQHPRAEAKIIRFSDKPGAAMAIADLSAAYAGRAVSVQRGVRLTGRDVLIQDEIKTLRPSDVWWFLHTGAKVECRGATAFLTQNGQQLTATLLSPPGAAFEVLPAAPFPSSPHPARQMVESPREALKKLAVHCPAADSLSITVLLSPGERAATTAAEAPLDKWK